MVLGVHILLVHVDGLCKGHWISHGTGSRCLMAQQVIDHGLGPIRLVMNLFTLRLSPS